MAAMKKFNGDENLSLKAAMALLIRNQAALAAQHTSFLDQMIEINKRIDKGRAEDRQRVDKKFDQLEAILMRHEQILVGLHEMLAGLPEAIRQKIGFKAK